MTITGIRQISSMTSEKKIAFLLLQSIFESVALFWDLPALPFTLMESQRQQRAAARPTVGRKN